MDYFSDKERGPRSRTGEEITPEAWGGIIALIRSLISIGAFGFKYPEMCPDGAGPVGTDEQALALALKAEIPEIEWPLQAPTEVIVGGGQDQESYVPDTFTILDLIQFSYQAVAKPIQGRYHDFFRHHHLTFEEDSGREQFRSTVNSILARNGIAYQLKADVNKGDGHEIMRFYFLHLNKNGTVVPFSCRIYYIILTLNLFCSNITLHIGNLI